ncbi:MAG: hypothetical protein M3137_21190 [Actinomycetota bacterium]|nr:hypothetical protein [Actinomycetota bacterium]
MSERLIVHYREVLAHLDPRSPGAVEAGDALCLARLTVEQAGGFDAELADIEAVAAHHANDYVPLVTRHWRQDRATMFAFVRTVELEATRADRSVLDAVEHALAHSHLTRDFIPAHVEGTVVDLSFASEQWQRLIRDAEHPGRLNRRTSRPASSPTWPGSCAPATCFRSARRRPLGSRSASVPAASVLLFGSTGCPAPAWGRVQRLIAHQHVAGDVTPRGTSHLASLMALRRPPLGRP